MPREREHSACLVGDGNRGGCEEVWLGKALSAQERICITLWSKMSKNQITESSWASTWSDSSEKWLFAWSFLICKNKKVQARLRSCACSLALKPSLCCTTHSSALAPSHLASLMTLFSQLIWDSLTQHPSPHHLRSGSEITSVTCETSGTTSHASSRTFTPRLSRFDIV